MSIIGNWKITDVLQFDDEKGFFWQSAREAADEDDTGEIAAMVVSVFVFSDDGFVRTICDVPEDLDQEDIDAAVATGEIEQTADGKLVFDKKEWKFEDGKYYIAIGTSEEDGVESINWEEMKVADNEVETPYFRLAREN